MATRIPINKDSFGFEDRQDEIWKKMERDMERRRKEWDEEIEKMSQDFFTMRPEKEKKFETLSDKISVSDNMDDAKTVIEKNEKGQPIFKAKFNVRDFKPEEVSVKMDASKIIVQAKHEEKTGPSSLSREFSREVNIPHEIDPMALQCSISPEGVLTVEAPFPVPDYFKEVSSTPTKMNITHTTNVSSSQSQPGSGPSTPSATSFQTSSAPLYHTPPSTQNSPFFGAQVGPQFHPPPPPPPPVQSDQFQTSAAGSPFHKPLFSGSPFQGSPISSTPFVNSSTSTRTGSPITVDRDKKFKLEIDIEDFKPEDLTVKTQDTKLVIGAHREEKVGNRTSTKELSRQFHIPENVDPVTIKAFFVDGGKLVVEAPFKPMTSGSCANGGPGGPMTGR